MDKDLAFEAPQCEGCGERPEVYGSSWCSGCQEHLPEYLKRRVLTMRNALIMIRFNSEKWSAHGIRDAAKKALDKPPPHRLQVSAKGDA